MAWLSIPIAALCARLLEVMKTKLLYRAISFVFFIVVFAGISLNLGQTYQHVKGFLHFDSNSRETYLYVFGKYILLDEDKNEFTRSLNIVDIEKMRSGEKRNQ